MIRISKHALTLILTIFFIILILNFSIRTPFKEEEEMKIPEEVKEVIDRIKTKIIMPYRRGIVPLKGKAIWTWGSTVTKYGANKIIEICNKLNIKHIFLLVKGVSGLVVYSVIRELLPIAHENGIYVHAWIICFEDKLNPNASPSSMEYRKHLLEIIAKFLTLNSNEDYIDGIHLDYIRYHGNAKDKWMDVSSFVKEVRLLIDEIAPGTILSIASKAENYRSRNGLIESALYYGQNYTDLAKYVDLFCPMTYYLDYGVKPSSIGRAAKWIKEITGKPVFAGIQLHPSENPRTKGRKPTGNEIEECLKSCINNGINGVIFFEMRFLIEKYNEYSNIITKYYSSNE